MGRFVAIPRRRHRRTALLAEGLVEMLVGLFEEVLETTGVDPDDSFIDLGGDSLAAARLFTAIERLVGADLPLATILEAPSPATLARIVRQASAPSWQRLIPVRPVGDGVPLVGVHGLYGNVVQVARLARHLDPSRPVYGLQAEALDGRRPRARTVTEMAEQFLADLRRRRPTGPYVVFGFSFGGLVAIEMGRALLAAGEDVIVLLGDTARPDRVATDGGLSGRRRSHAVNLRARRSLADRLRYVRWRLDARWRRRVAPRLAVVVLRLRGRVPAGLREPFVGHVNVLATRGHVVEPYPGEVVLFRSDAPDPEPDRGWRGVVSSLTVVPVPGAHNDLMQEPQVGDLGRLIEEVLVARFPRVGDVEDPEADAG